MKLRRSNRNRATDPPGAVSNQNREEAESEHRDDGTHPEPRTTGHEPKDKGKPSGASSSEDGGSSQSTGHR